ncbi:MAG: alanine racemase [Ruminococcaceae bacterium]|nr:alanine racemase [Oscillospiraceae bacterium]
MLPSRVYAEINLDTAKQNMKNIMALAGEGTDVMAVVKADGYGHGAVRLAKAYESIGVKFFGVATAEEALSLRQNGISGDILILSYVFPDRFEAVIENNVISTVFDLETAEMLNETAKRLNKKARVHIKLDTGMGRIGFIPNEESLEAIKKIALKDYISLEGIYSHLACADESDLTSARNQIELFDGFCNSLSENGVDIKIRHIRNSAGIMNFPDYKTGLVRCGIIAYGIYPSNEVDRNKLDIKPIMQLKSRISYVKTVGEGFAVSYGSTFVTDKKTVIATVPVGYGDGYPRALSNRGYVLVNGRKAKIIGRICMDQFMIDVTDIPVKRGDEVILIGSDGINEITVDDIAFVSGGFNYEIICDINDRVPRVYYENGKEVETLEYKVRS